MSAPLPVDPSSERVLQHLAGLQRSIPVVGDKALLDLVNGIQVERDVLRFRRQRNLLGRILDEIDGSEWARGGLVLDTLVTGQAALVDWMKQLTGSLTVTQVALTLAQESLLQAREGMRTQSSRIDGVEALLREAARELAVRIDELDARVHRLQIRVSADEDLDRALAAWSSGRTYPGMPWPVQVVLLGREIFSGAVGVYEAETADRERYRDLLVDKIMAGAHAPATWFALADLLSLVCGEVRPEHRSVVAGLLETRTLAWRRSAAMPYSFVLGTAVELGGLQEAVRPVDVGGCAMGLAAELIRPLRRTVDARSLARSLVDETADDCLAVLSRPPIREARLGGSGWGGGGRSGFPGPQ